MCWPTFRRYDGMVRLANSLAGVLAKTSRRRWRCRVGHRQWMGTRFAADDVRGASR